MKKFAKTLVMTGIVGAAALLTTPAFAAEGSTEKENSAGDQVLIDPGMTPENTFYFLDKFGEKFHLFFTNNAEKKSNLYLKYAEERLAESAELTDAAKEKYTKGLVEAYTANLQKAQDKIAEVVVDEKVAADIKKRLANKLEKVTTVITTNSLEQSLNEKQRKSLERTKQEGYLVANTIKDIDVEKVKTMQDLGLHFGEIVKVIALAEQSGKSEEEIVGMLQEKHQKFGTIARELNIEQSEMWKKVNLEKANAAQKTYEKALLSGNQSEIERIGKKIDRISNEQAALGINESASNRYTGADKKLAIIQQKADAGLIPQGKADMIAQKIQMNQEKQRAYSQVDKKVNPQGSKDSEEKSQQKAEKIAEKQAKKEQEKIVKNENKAKDKAAEQTKKNQEKAVKNDSKAKEKAAEKTKKDQEKAAENDREAKEKAAEQTKKDQEKAAENDRKAKEKAAEKTKKEQEKAAENDRKAKDKAAEQAKKEQEKAAENDRKAKDKAAEQAKKEQEKAAENDRKAKDKAAEQAKKEQEKAEENDRKAKEKAADQAKKDQEKAAENDRKAKEKAAEQAKKDQEKAAENDRKAKDKAADQANKEREKAAENDRKSQEKAAQQAQKNQEKDAKNKEKQSGKSED